LDRTQIQEKYGLIGSSPALMQLIDKILQVARTDITILLQGESGVGKDVAARTIHGLSRRSSKNLVIVNCGAIPEGIIESELFGHEKGSFTGAHESRQGYFEKADGGTIFLDEIGDTPKNVQVKLLRILESGEFYRVGSSQVRTTDVRIIAATNRDLWKDVQKGDFREDLYYRLETVNIKIPPLRERQDDIIPIFLKFVKEFAAKYDSVFQGFEDDARELLVSYRWPGNIRELRNVAEQLVVLERSQFITRHILSKYLKGRQHLGSPDNLPMIYSGDHHTDDPLYNRDRELVYRALIELRKEISDMKQLMGTFIYSSLGERGQHRALPVAGSNYPDDQPHRSHERDYGMPIGMNSPEDDEIEQEYDEHEENPLLNGDKIPSIEDAEKYLIKKALDKYEGNRRKASEALGMSERTLYRKLDQYGLV
jgi:DNA-binding NtrC family response regulator